MQPRPTPSGRWEADLAGFFASLDQEDQTYLRNSDRKASFYADTARPALEAAAEVLRQHRRVCEVGLDQNRVYLIVRRPEGAVEFQYALLAEVRIEAVVPYVHCWFEEDALADKAAEQDDKKDAQGGPEEPEGDGQEEGDDDEGDEKKDKDKKDDKKPARTKTIEVLASWTDGRPLESVTREEILADFTAHYQEAVTRLRAHLHLAPAAPAPQS